MQSVHSANSRTHKRADPGTIFFFQIQARVGESHPRGCNRKLCEPVHPARFLLVNERRWIKTFDFPGNFRIIIGSVKSGDQTNSGLTCQQCLPERFRCISNRSNRA